jgi:hypothetical protein
MDHTTRPCILVARSNRDRFLELLFGFAPISIDIIIHLISSLFWQAKQLKDYENAVIAKRLEELDEDEVRALQEEISRDDF